MEKQSLFKYPLLIEEWDYDSNKTQPEDHMSEERTKVYWKCSKCGYRWKAPINDRTCHGSGCPNCSFVFRISSPEQAFYYYVKQAFPDAISSYKPDFLTGMKVDVYVPSLHLAIEYSKKHLPDSVKRDLRKSELLRKHSIKLIRIKENGSSNPYNDYAVIQSEYINKLGDLLPAVKELFQYISDLCGTTINADINMEVDAPAIYALSEGVYYSKTLQASGTDVLTEWAYDLNGALTPDKVTPGSWKTVWWRCSFCGKEYQQSIKTKVKSGLGCESCSEMKAEEKRLATEMDKEKPVLENQYLLSEWDDIEDPATISCNSKYVAQWKCSICGNTFKMSVKNRTGQKPGGCPICRRKTAAAKRCYPVINITTGKVYHSINEACRDTRVPIASIRDCCLGKKSSAGGFEWAYTNHSSSIIKKS